MIIGESTINLWIVPSINLPVDGIFFSVIGMLSNWVYVIDPSLFEITKVNCGILNDPLNTELWHHMRSKAYINSAIYSDIFDCFPDNKFNNFAKLKERKIFKKEDEEKLKEEYKNKNIGIIGHIVEYPIEFLKDEELDIDFFSKENLVPERNFV